jgi:hypothetical protein
LGKEVLELFAASDERDEQQLLSAIKEKVQQVQIKIDQAKEMVVEHGDSELNTE